VKLCIFKIDPNFLWAKTKGDF